MKIDLRKFGKILVSRSDGREAYLVMSAYITKGLSENEDIEINFSGVKVLAPGWADEVITKIASDFKNIKLINTANLSVNATLKFLKKVNGYRLNIK